MAQIKIEYKPIQTLGYVICDVPDEIMSITNNAVNEMIATRFKNATPNNKNLAGAIEHEYRFTTPGPLLNSFFKKIIPEYFKLQGDFKRANNTYQISNLSNKGYDLWINIQQKYEFNPIHDHSGMLSFVYYVRIPYNNEEEKNLPHVKNSNTVDSPYFAFVYPSHAYGHDIRYPVQEHKLILDKSYEGKMIIFPSSLQHTVTPFYTTDDYRISVAGNITLVD